MKRPLCIVALCIVSIVVWSKKKDGIETRLGSSIASGLSYTHLGFDIVQAGDLPPPLLWKDDHLIHDSFKNKKQILQNIIPFGLNPINCLITNNVLYVDSSVLVNGDGSSWPQALQTFSEALWIAKNCLEVDSILVAKGTYYPTGVQNGTNRDSAFAIHRGGLKILGGFPNGGGNRDFNNFLTTLSGDIGSLNDSTDNSYHVMVISGVDSLADSLIISGFQVEHGQADGMGNKSIGGKSISREHAGGIIIFSNTSREIEIRDCHIINNVGSKAGGIYNSVSQPRFYNSVIKGNKSLATGGGLYNLTSSPEIINVLISGNWAGTSGGGIYNSSNAHPKLINNTIVSNFATNGGGIYNTSTCNPEIRNTIIHGNSSGVISNTILIQHSLVQSLVGGTNGNLNGNMDPLFINPLSFNAAPTISGNYSLLSCSPAINVGNTSILPGYAVSDLTDRARIIDNVVDLGAYEFQGLLIDTLISAICSDDSFLFNSVYYNVAGVYVDTFLGAGGCDSFVALNLIVNPVAITTLTESICSGSSYSFGGQNISIAGIYQDTLLTTFGCDSIVILDLMVNPVATTTLIERICSGSSISFGGQNISVAGIYHDTLLTALGCDSIIILDLTVNPIAATTLTESICFGSSYFFGGQDISISGIYQDTLQTVFGCDSVITLDLMVNPIATTTLVESICFGSSYLFGGQNISISGIYHDTLQTAFDCDSVITLDLMVNPIATTTLVESICSGGSISFGGQNISIAGIYHDTLQTVFGCDSIVTLNLIVNPVATTTLMESVCSGSSYLFGGQNISIAGIYHDTLQTVFGCDSIITLDLNFYPDALFFTIDTAACGSLLFEGQTYVNDVILVDTITSSQGCDSLYISVNIRIYDISLTMVDLDTAGCDVVLFEGNTYFENTVILNTYKDDNGCDSLFRRVNIWVSKAIFDTIYISICEGEEYVFNNAIYFSTGIYTAVFPYANGCDSNVTLILNVHKLPEIAIVAESNLNGYCIGDKIWLHGKGGEFYFWKSSYEQDYGTGDSVEVLLLNSQTQFFIKGWDQLGCQSASNINVEATACCSVFVPSAFSPNMDGLNDQFGVETDGHPLEFRFQVFDRYGKQVFVSFKTEDKWDGTINGLPAPIGVYFFYVTGKCVNGTLIQQKGDVTLMR